MVVRKFAITVPTDKDVGKSIQFYLSIVILMIVLAQAFKFYHLTILSNFAAFSFLSATAFLLYSLTIGSRKLKASAKGLKKVGWSALISAKLLAIAFVMFVLTLYSWTIAPMVLESVGTFGGLVSVLLGAGMFYFSLASREYLR